VAGLRERGCQVPIVADIHFKPMPRWRRRSGWRKSASIRATTPTARSSTSANTPTLNTLRNSTAFRERFSPLVRFCKEYGRALRIGTNHGSLSDRIMNRYGDTPLGMVESALEFARIARDLGFHEFVFSMKSSNPKVMIEAYRLLSPLAL
jgi:(E)-4-hydroxy-3-methylbut-2-enyl-diphosphate synthase